MRAADVQIVPDISDIPAALEAALTEFRTSPVGHQLSDPGQAKGRCKPSAIALLGLLHERGFTDACLVNFTKPGAEHYVVRLADIAIDPSARQFDREADVPRVVGYRSIAKEWDAYSPVIFGNAWDRKLHKLPARPPEWRLAQRELPDRTSAADQLASP
jgi:hypothetical protein